MHASAHDPMSSGSGRLLGWRKNASFASSWPQSPREKAAAQLRAEMADVRPFLPEAESPIDWENESSCAAHSLMNMLENKARCAEHRRSVFSTLLRRLRLPNLRRNRGCRSPRSNHQRGNQRTPKRNVTFGHRDLINAVSKCDPEEDGSNDSADATECTEVTHNSVGAVGEISRAAASSCTRPAAVPTQGRRHDRRLRDLTHDFDQLARDRDRDGCGVAQRERKLRESSCADVYVGTSPSLQKSSTDERIDDRNDPLLQAADPEWAWAASTVDSWKISRSCSSAPHGDKLQRSGMLHGTA